MPEFTVKEVRLPELHLPEVKRDEIVRALSGIRVPEVDLTKVEPRRRLRNVDLGALPWRRRGMTVADAGRLIATAVTAARLARPARSRPRWSPLRRSRWDAVARSRDNLVAVVRPAPRRSRRRLAAVVIAMTAAAAWMLFRNPAVRARLGRAAADARRRIDEMRNPSADVDLATGEPVSVITTPELPGAATDIVAAEANIESTEPATDPG